MANIMIWITIMLTVPVGCLSQTATPAPVLLDQSMVMASCTASESIVTLDLTGVYPRPTTVIINEDISSPCTRNITGATDIKTIIVDLTQCGIFGSPKEYTLHIMQKPVYSFKGDLFVRITCTNVNVVMIETQVDFDTVTPFTKPAEGTVLPNANDVAITISPAFGVNLGDTITLTITAGVNVSFEVTGCTVESIDKGTNLIGPYAITNGWCTIDSDLLSTFQNNNTAPMTSTSTITAFRLAGQEPSAPLIFKCSLKWCPSLGPFCKHPDSPTCTTTRRRRAIDADIGQYANEKTLTSSILVNLPGFASKTDVSGASVITGIDSIAKLAVLLLGGVYSII